MNIELELNGLNCVNCADKIQDISSNIDGVLNSKLNFVTKKLQVQLDDSGSYREIKDEIVAVVNKLEPGVEVIELSKEVSSPTIMELELNGLDCTDCSNKIVDMSKKLDGVNEAKFNFVTKKMEVVLNDVSDYDSVYEEIFGIIKDLEPGVEVLDITKTLGRTKSINLELNGLDCADCSQKIENFTRSIKGVESANFDFLTGKFKVEVRQDINVLDVKDEVKDIVNTLEPDVEIIDLDSIDRESKSEKKIKSSLLDQTNKKQLGQIAIAGILALFPTIFGLDGVAGFLLYFVSYLIVGHKVIIQAFKNVRAGVPFDENFLMTIATIAAFVTKNYTEAVMVMLLYQIGEMMQGIAVNHSRNSISSLMDIRPDYANLERNGEVLVVDPNDVKIGDRIIIRPGERVPLDGVVVEGDSSLDTSNITGESVPRSVKEGDEVLSGVVNLQGVLTLEVEKEFGESTISEILDLVENASSEKAETENFITKFSRYYTPVVVFIALGLAVIPPFLGKGAWMDWMYRAAVFLVISCPCALVISVPLGFFGGLGGASKAGVLVKGGNYLEALADVDTIVFDKTGTVTEGVFDVTEIKAFGEYSKEEILKLAAYGEAYSTHPIGKSIVDKYGEKIDSDILSNYEDIAGKGIDVDIDGDNVLLGNKSLFDSNNIEINQMDSIGTVVYVGRNGKHIGTIIVSDRIKDNADTALRHLKKVGIKRTVMLSGDNSTTVKQVGDILNINEVHGDLLPQDKVDIFEGIITSKKGKNKVAFVGDGVNDAPVLARADVGIAMGGLGSDAAIEASDIVIMTDDIGQISTGINIAKNTRKIVYQNIALALGVKLVVLVLGAMGSASMWQAVFADVGVSIIAILNSIRALKVIETK